MPLTAFLQYGHPVATYLMSENLDFIGWVAGSALGRNTLKKFLQDGEKMNAKDDNLRTLVMTALKNKFDKLAVAEPKKYTVSVGATSYIEVVDSTCTEYVNLQKTTVLEAIKVYRPNATGSSLEQILVQLKIPVQQAKKLLQVEMPTKATYAEFIGLLGMSLANSRIMVEPVAAVYKQDNKSIFTELWTIHSGLLWVSGTWSSTLLNSSSELREYIAKGLKSQCAQDDVLGVKEAAVYKSWQLPNVANANEDNILQFCTDKQQPFSGKSWKCDDGRNIVKRIKLLLLSHELREALKALKVVVLVGPTKSGKSTLREKLVHPENPNTNCFGGSYKQRTSIPELFVIGTDAGKPMCILDTIWLGERAHAKEVEQVNRLFEQMAVATVIVCKESDNSPTTRSFLGRTSRLCTQPEALSHPVLTCFNQADAVFSSNFPEEEPPERNGVTMLNRESDARQVHDYFFDVRHPEVDNFAPRVWTAFDSLAPVPEYMRGTTVFTAPEVRSWLESVFYPSTA